MRRIYVTNTRAIVVAITIAFGIGLSNQSFAVDYGGVGGKPAYPRADNPRTDSIFVHTLEPGQTQTEAVQVLNNTSESKTISVYAVDSLISTDGAFGCRQLSDPLDSVGSWITLETTAVTLEPATNQTVPFTITVPADAEVGEHNGCIVLEEQKPALETEGGVYLSFRSAIRVAITVPGEIIRQLTVADFTITREGITRPPGIDVAVVNAGNVSLDADLGIVTKNSFGQVVVEHGGVYPVLRGQTADWHFELPQPFWGGLYQTTLSVAYDGAEAASLGEASGAAPTILNQTSSWFVVIPSLYGALIEGAVLLGLIILVGVVVKMRQRQHQIKKTWVKYTAKNRDSIKQLAEQYAVSWKLLAKINRLSAPYHITVGTELRVPPTIESTKVMANQFDKNDKKPANKKPSQPAQRSKQVAR